jgi:hypothetical protein
MKNEHWWHYYGVALALKVPLAMLVLLLLTVVQAILVARRRPQEGVILACLFIPCAVFFLFFSLVCQSQLGLRLILPAFPFVYVASGCLSPQLFMGKPGSRIFGVLLLGGYLAASLFIHPHYLAYFNVLSGGPSRGVEYLADSNLDWGQDLKGLRKYMDEEGIDAVRLLYYGPDGLVEPAYYGITTPPKEVPGVPWAVSATWLYYPRYSRFKNQAPHDRIGYSIFLYPTRR